MKDHPLLEINSKEKYSYCLNLNDFKKRKMKFFQSDDIIKKYYTNLTFEETQIYRKNKKILIVKDILKFLTILILFLNFVFHALKSK